ncbi:MAG: cytochrome P450 [Chloroflexi bacterium]|nr:cytochrome P450 [Chloroflexota bacterium]
MALSDFNPIDPETLECPYPFYAALHAEAPVYPAPELGATIVSGYDLLQEVVHDPETYSSAMAVGGAALPGRAKVEPDAELAQLRRTFGRASVPTLLAADPPYHRRYRSLVEKALAPRRIMGMEGYVREIVTDLIDGFIDEGQVNFTKQFADELPMAVIADQIGVARSDLKEFKRRADFAIGGIERSIPPDEERAILKAGIELQEFFLERAEERRRNPQDDILTTLATAELETDDGSRPLTDGEILSILQQLQVAGKETTAHLIGSAMLLFIENPDQLGAVQADPSLIGNMAEEALRVESPVRALFRTTTRPVTLGGVELEADTRLMLLYSAANRDECAFANAAQFDVSRENAPRHVAFSAGPHYCIGAALARLEIRIAFEEVLGRMTNIRLDPAYPAPTHVPSFILRGLNDLHILFDRA